MVSPQLFLALLPCLARAQSTQFQREVEAPLGCAVAEQARKGDLLSMEYKGFLADGTVFDSNVGGKPLQFTLGDGKVIPGWEKGLGRTCPGEQVVMIIPPELGYGEAGAGDVIPAGATLYFITKLQGLNRRVAGGGCSEAKQAHKGDKVTMRSAVRLMSSSSGPGREIDTSQDTVVVGAGKVAPGWDEALVGVCEGEERRLVLGPSLAWGTAGLPGLVPANSSVVIDMTVEKVERDLVFNFLNQISSGTFRRG